MDVKIVLLAPNRPRIRNPFPGLTEFALGPKKPIQVYEQIDGQWSLRKTLRRQTDQPKSFIFAVPCRTAPDQSASDPPVVNRINRAPVWELRELAKASEGDLRGGIDTAMTDFNRATQVKPRFARAYNDRGSVRATKGDIDGAISDFNCAIRVSPQ